MTNSDISPVDSCYVQPPTGVFPFSGSIGMNQNPCFSKEVSHQEVYSQVPFHSGWNIASLKLTNQRFPLVSKTSALKGIWELFDERC